MRKKERNSSFELLRILAIMLIILFHYSLYGFLNIKWENVSTFNTAWIDCMALGGKLGVNIFVLISAYFMVNRKFSLKKLLILYGEVWFYSVTITMLMVYFKPMGMPSTDKIIYSFLPITFTRYWFITDYVIIMLLSPMLNFLIHKMDRDMYKKALAIMIILTCISGVYPEAFTDANNELIIFFVLYFIAGYIRLYGNSEDKKPVRHFMTALASYSALILIAIAVAVVGKNIGFNIFSKYHKYFRGMGNPLVLLASIELMIGAARLPHFSSKIINIIAGTSFGVYLIHDNRLVRTFLWKHLFKTTDAAYDNNIVLHTLKALIILYASCIVIDIIRQYTIEKLWLKILDKSSFIKHKLLRK